LSTAAVRVLVWQWGRKGAGPRFAVELAGALATLPNVTPLLSLSTGSEQLRANPGLPCALPYRTYAGLPGFVLRVLSLPVLLPALIRKLRALAPDVAICAMPAALDLLMAAALRRLGVSYFVIVHDADIHPGDGLPMQMTLQRRLTAGASGLVTLSDHVARRLIEQGLAGGRPLIRLYHPPFAMGPQPPPPGAHGGKLRLLFFGRLLPYKGLDLFASALRCIGQQPGIEIRVVGQGPENAALSGLRATQGVTVENRWVPEGEVAGLLGWADALVLSHTEASQSGVAAAAQATRRWIIATRVGGLVEQLRNEPLAVLCDPTPDSLAAAILSLLNDPPQDAPTEAAPSWHDMANALIGQLRASVT
jgi:glycosyltransferase involved in cell wall biosynthesis